MIGDIELKVEGSIFAAMKKLIEKNPTPKTEHLPLATKVESTLAKTQIIYLTLSVESPCYNV